MSKKDEYYIHLMDALELIHAENVLIMNTLITLTRDKNAEYMINESTKGWTKRFEDIRKHW